MLGEGYERPPCKTRRNQVACTRISLAIRLQVCGPGLDWLSNGGELCWPSASIRQLEIVSRCQATGGASLAKQVSMQLAARHNIISSFTGAYSTEERAAGAASRRALAPNTEAPSHIYKDYDPARIKVTGA
jgi:hypothetical protein